MEGHIIWVIFTIFGRKNCNYIRKFGDYLGHSALEQDCRCVHVDHEQIKFKITMVNFDLLTELDSSNGGSGVTKLATRVDSLATGSDLEA